MNSIRNVVLADDDVDDHMMFQDVLNQVLSHARLTTISDGEKLMNYLSENIKQLPDIIFLDLNMPRKKGCECLSEIKLDKQLKHIPIVMYSTVFHTEVIDLFYNYGASYCIHKSSNTFDLKKNLYTAIEGIVKNRTMQPPRENFLLDFVNSKQSQN